MAINHPRFSANGTGKHAEPVPPPVEERNRKTAEALAPRYDTLNRLWAEAEARLKAMQMPRYVWVAYKSVDVDPQYEYSPKECDCLGLVKYRGEWRLCHGSFTLDEYTTDPRIPDQPADWRPISDCMVEDRVEAAPHIGMLRDKIVASAEEFIAKADQAIAQLTKALEQF